MTLPAMPPLTDPLAVEKAARLLAPARSASTRTMSGASGGTGRGAAEEESEGLKVGRARGASVAPSRKNRRGEHELPTTAERAAPSARIGA